MSDKPQNPCFIVCTIGADDSEIRKASTWISIFSLVVSIVGVALVVWELHKSTNAFRHSTEMQIRMTSLEFTDEIHRIPGGRAFLTSGQNLEADALISARSWMHRYTNFVSMIFRLQRDEIITEELWHTVLDNTCGLLSGPSYEIYWIENVIDQDRSYDEEFRQLRQVCDNRNEGT